VTEFVILFIIAGSIHYMKHKVHIRWSLSSYTL